MPPRKKKVMEYAWFQDPTGQDDLVDFKMALAQYFVKNPEKRKGAEPKVKLYLEVIPFLARIDPRWSVVDLDNFSPTRYKAHAAFADTMRNLLCSRRELSNWIRKANPQQQPSQPSEEKPRETGHMVEIEAEDPSVAGDYLDHGEQIISSATMVGGPSFSIMGPEHFLVGNKRRHSQISGPIPREASSEPGRLEQLEWLHDDMMAKKVAYEDAHAEWKRFKDALTCLHSPRLSTEQ
jgi:hypothetical protein